jgi:epoxyqueuosine reductase
VDGFTDEIKKQALREGFDKVGVVRAERLDAEAPRLKEWLARGHHGEMAWMARDVEKRLNPLEIFPQARSIVVVALNYYTPAQHEENSNTGKVSRYAWGDDYHDVLKTKLESLLSWIRERVPEAAGKICVDIQPVMDKAWAVRAGIGWLGKHSNVITQEFGSWVFIGELLLNLELDADAEVSEDHCGTCTLCIDACPTQAITEPYVVDSNRCISYATIELRTSELPESIQQRLSGWLYGCFAPREGNVNADLGAVLELTPETYAARFRGSAMKRAKLHALQRNARALSSA